MSRLVVRQALPSDKPAVVALTREVWNGNDYVPFVWDRWLADPSGTTIAATLEGGLVGVQHVALHPDGSAWLEGIRVAADRQGQGIGAALLGAGLEWARQSGCPVARLSVSSSNPASNRITQRAGMDVVGEFFPLEKCEVTDRPCLPVRVAATTEAARIWRFLETCGHPAPGGLFYTEGWTAYRLSPQRLHLLLATQAVVWAGERGEIEAVAFATCSPTRPRLRLGLIKGSAEGVATLSSWLVERAERALLSDVRGPVELTPSAAAGLRAGGLEPVSDHRMLLRELRL